MNFAELDIHFQNLFQNQLISIFSEYTKFQGLVKKMRQPGMEIHLKRIINYLQADFKEIKQFLQKQFDEIQAFIESKVKALDRLKGRYMKCSHRMTYDFQSLKEVLEVQAHENQSITQIQISEDYVIACSTDSTISIWNKQLQLQHRIVGAHNNWIRAIQIDNDMLYSSGDDSKVNIYDSEFILKKCITGLIPTYVREIQIVGQYIVCARGAKCDFELFVHDKINGDLLYTIKQHKVYLQGTYSCGPCFISYDPTGQFYMIKLRSQGYLIVHKMIKEVKSICRNVNTFLVGTANGKIQIMSRKLRIIQVLSVANTQITQIQMINNTYMVFSHYPHFIQIYDLEKLQPVYRLKQFGLTYFCVDTFYDCIYFGNKNGILGRHEYEKIMN